MTRNSHLLVCDDEQYLDKNKHNHREKDILYWNSFSCSKGDRVFSLPIIVEESAEKLKANYLKLIYEFGEARVQDKRVIEHLKIRKNLSYWWMTLISESCNYAKSPQIDNIVKLMALEQHLLLNKYKLIIFKTSNKELARSAIILAKKMSIEIKCITFNERLNSIKSFKVYRNLPNIIKSLAWLIYYIVSNWQLKGSGVKEWKKTDAKTTFVSYLFNLDSESSKNGIFKSQYWGKLTSVMNNKNISTNWLHIYIKNDSTPSANKAKKLIKKFNKVAKGNEVHVTLESFLSLKIICNTFIDWFKLLRIKNLVSKKIKHESGYLWPLFKKDCIESMSGVAAISNLVYLNLFENAMNALPVQNKGCYLQENQGWEFGFISAWKAAGHKKNLVGFPHSTIRYWDLRYFFDPKNFINSSFLDLPRADYLGINGDISKKNLLSGAFIKNEFIELESLRYLYLNNFSLNQKSLRINNPNEITILVFGDYLKEKTYDQLNVLSLAVEKIKKPVRFIIKPHPACPINLKDFPGLSAEVQTLSIEELLKQSDAVYSSLITSASIDAYCVGLPVISLLDGKTLNMSPLRGSKSVYFVKNSEDLSRALNTITPIDRYHLNYYFYLDPDLPNWLNWLSDDFNKVKLK